jgi:hypothetical protein
MDLSELIMDDGLNQRRQERSGGVEGIRSDFGHAVFRRAPLSQ